jgi:ammonium transporter, Amt family
MVFQMMFAVITPALIIGAFAERMKFSAFLIFSLLWATLVYDPMAHWVWGVGGWLRNLGALDFAGGTVVHINAGVAGLVGAYVIGKRTGFGKEHMAPHNVTMTMIGASLLWVGWFGFNAGSALEANGSASLAFMNTYLATACAVLSWMFGEWIFKSKPSMLGAASGAVAGLVAITPAAGNVGIPGAFVIGTGAGLVCLWGVNQLKGWLKADDSLDVFGVHAVGGIFGALMTGIFNSPSLGGPGFYNNWFEMKPGYGAIMDQFIIQAKAVGVTVVWTAVVAFIAYKIADLIVGLRVTSEEEREGLDTTSHGESAYRL